MWGRTLQFLPTKNIREGLLPWVIGVMLFLSTLALVSTITIGIGLDRWSQGLTSNFSVQIAVKDVAEREIQTSAALRMIRATPGIESAVVLADAEILALLSPWLGEMTSTSSLPIPTLIEVRLAPGAEVNTTALAERLKATAAGAQLDDHQAWMMQILDLASVVQILLIGVVAMVLLATIAIVTFGCRAGLATHHESIEIMHLMGADDSTISRAFDMRYMGHGLKGGVVGVLLAGLTLWLLSVMAERLGQGLLTASITDTSGFLWLAILPLLSALITMITARITVRRALREMM